MSIEEIERKKLHLIQCGHFCREIESIRSDKIKGLNDVVDFDNVDPIRFEFGSIPQSLMRMTLSKDYYRVFVFNDYKDVKDNPLKVYASYIYFRKVLGVVEQLADSNMLQLDCSLYKHIQDEDPYKDDLIFCYQDDKRFWWDLENDFFIFFEHTDKVLRAMNVLRKKKYGYKRNKTPRTLNKYYLNMLTCSNPRYISNTIVKNYSYDQNNHMHYIEFKDDMSLKDKIIETIVIAKVSGEQVTLNVDGIPFVIDSEFVKDKKIVDNKIELVDSRTYYDVIDKLMSYYNNKIPKEHVLRLVKDNK